MYIQTNFWRVFYYTMGLIHVIRYSFSGNSWDCICELSYFVGFLLNNSHIIEIEDIDELKCASPASLKGTSLNNIDFTPLNCDYKEETDDYDYASSETQSTKDGTTVPLTSTIVHFTTEHMSTTNSSFTDDSTISISPTTEESSTTKETQSSTQEISSTSEIQSTTTENQPTTTEIQPITTEIQSTTQEISSTLEIQPTTTEIQSTTTEMSSTTEIQSTTQDISSTTEVQSSTKTIISKSGKLIDYEDVTSTTFSQSSTVPTIPIKSTTTPIPKVTPDLSVKILEYLVKDKEFCVRWSLSELTLHKMTCSISCFGITQ